MGGTVRLEGEVEKGRFDRNTTLGEMRGKSRLADLACWLAERVVAHRHRGGAAAAEYRMTLACALDAPMRHVVINSGGLLPEGLAAFLVALANGRPLRGLRRLLRPGRGW